MEVNEFAPIDPNTNLEKILPIQQKRIVTFINHFVSDTVSFLNHFAQSCESRLMDFEYKMQKVEASLLILESQLSSIPNLLDNKDVVSNLEIVQEQKVVVEEHLELPEIVTEREIHHVDVESMQGGPKASEDPRFKKFFKMVQFGVPSAAVKLKMDVEGVDPAILDTPNEVIPYYETEG